MPGLSALRRSGRFMGIVSSPDSRDCRTISLLMGVGLCVVHCCLPRPSSGLTPTRGRSLLRHKRTPRDIERLKRLVAGNSTQQLVIVPASLRFRGLLHLEQIHVVDHAAVLTNFAVPGEEVV